MKRYHSLYITFDFSKGQVNTNVYESIHEYFYSLKVKGGDIQYHGQTHVQSKLVGTKSTNHFEDMIPKECSIREYRVHQINYCHDGKHFSAIQLVLIDKDGKTLHQLFHGKQTHHLKKWEVPSDEKIVKANVSHVSGNVSGIIIETDQGTSHVIGNKAEGENIEVEGQLVGISGNFEEYLTLIGFMSIK